MKKLKMVSLEEQKIYNRQNPVLKELDDKLDAKFIGIKDNFICLELPTIKIKE
jgi:hypothetical protein